MYTGTLIGIFLCNIRKCLWTTNYIVAGARVTALAAVGAVCRTTCTAVNQLRHVTMVVSSNGSFICTYAVTDYTKKDTRYLQKYFTVLMFLHVTIVRVRRMLKIGQYCNVLSVQQAVIFTAYKLHRLLAASVLGAGVYECRMLNNHICSFASLPHRDLFH